MEILQTGIESLVKNSVDEPWKIMFISPVTEKKVEATLGREGNVEVGPRLSEVLSSIEEHQVYPRTITGKELEALGMNTRDSFVIRVMMGVPVHIEVSFRPYRRYMNPTVPKVKGRNEETLYEPDKNPAEEPTFTASFLPSQGLSTSFSSEISDKEYIVAGKVTKVKDGDTMDFEVEQVGKRLKGKDFKKGSTITIRFAGINTPETKEHGIQEGIKRNKEFAEEYGIDDEDKVFEIGQEAFEKLEDFLDGSGYVILDMDAGLDGIVRQDIYGRYLAAVYKTSITDVDDIFDEESFTAPQLNKLMLGTRSTINSKAPLAMPYYYFIDNQYSRLSPANWLYELGIRRYSQDKLGDGIDNIEKKRKNAETPLDTAPVKVVYEESGSNQIDFMEPYDDRVENEDIFKDGVDHQVRIGDVMLTIPPLAIEVNRSSSIQKVKTLRTKSSMIIKGGSSATTLTMQLYFHDLESINGHKVKMHKEKDRYYYMDGLRPLIAQFKKAPFVPIDNIYINETLGIDSVALVNLTVDSVPGFPHSIAATLTLAKFDHSAYMPQVARLGDAMNYPMFRWYYQEPLRDDISKEDRSPYRTYLDSIPEGGLTNDFKFLIASEDDLIMRKQAIQKMRSLVNPILAEEKFENPGTSLIGSVDSEDTAIFTQLGKEFKDGVAAQKVLEQYKRYIAFKKEGKIPTKRTEDGEMRQGDLISMNNTGFKPVGKEVFVGLYGDGKKDEDVLKVSHYAPFETWISWKETRVTNEGTLHSESWPERNEGSIKLRLYDESNARLFDEEYRRGKEGQFYIVVVPGNYLDKLDKIISKGRTAEQAYVDSIQEWDETKATVQLTEGELRLEEYPITGELIPTSVSIMYENQFSNIQLQALDSPSFQFLGGQDPYVQVTFEADEIGVQEVRSLLEKTEEYSRIYRTGITSGFLGVENHLMQLFGVETVMPEIVQIRTVAGFPGRYQIEMSLCGFNKTQKRTEQLEGVSPIYGDNIARDDRKAGNFDAAADEAIIEMKMNDMEIYPDLEMPTYQELINSLRYMNANCTVYKNRRGGKYLDPDFYMSTPITAREIIREERYNNHSLTIRDNMGVEMMTGSQSPDMLEGDESMWEILNNVDRNTQQVSTTFSWSGDVTSKDAGESNAGGIVYNSSDVEEYVKDKNKIKEPPTFDEWKSWGKGSDPRAYDNWIKEIANPEEWKVYNKIYELVDKYWVEDGSVYNDKKVDIDDKAWQKVTYATVDDLWDANWNYLAKKDPDLVKDNQEKKHKTEISKKDFKATDSKVPRERIANIFKAIIHVRSRWQQLRSSGGPIIDTAGNACGICGVPLSSEAEGIREAKRLLWDWEYNMESAASFLFDAYKEAKKKKALEYRCRPWEWMISAYATGTIEGDLKNGFWQQVNSTLNTHYNNAELIYATPSSPLSMVIMQQRNSYDSVYMGVLKGEKEATIKTLLRMGYRKNKDATEAETKKWLEGKTETQVVDIYNEWGNEQFDGTDEWKEASGSEASMAAATGNSYQVDTNRDNNPEGAGIYAELNSAKTFIDNALNKRLVNQDNPSDVFPDMFIDMIEYDQRMRLVRAFPTFQMFIVDEGRWMTNYRLWDNLYGFNAIQSIDVHKSRKISADTAIIQMTNIYSNLTSQTMDTSYGEWDYKFWDNLVFGNPNEKLLEARKELLDNMLLATGARVHLRMGYGSSVGDLPVVFNGTITEMNTGEIVEIVAQGDGVELGNVISGDPGDDNKSLLKGITEPRDLICELLTSKGNWFKDVINYVSDGGLFKDNPLGIMHFGQPGEVTPEGNWKFFNENYGEAAQNIYSSNGIPTFSQWVYADGSDIPFSFFDTPMLKWFQPGDEQNVVVPFYNNTVWDIVQTLAYCSTDYIAAVHPFEMRSTLFFGKPYWRMAYKYDSHYEYDEKQKGWIRYRDLEHRKPYSQMHFFGSDMDIVGNNIKASEEGVYTNVIGNYDGKQSGIVYADWDIRFDKQKTTVLDVQIVSRVNGLDFWTSEKQAFYYSISAVRDYMKDMYKGDLIVLGDPTLKPYDTCYMQDVMTDMNGNFQIKAVTHQFSQETGFISSVQPDALAVSDDLAILSMANWAAAFGMRFGSTLAGYKFGAAVIKKAIPSSVSSKAISLSKSGASKATETVVSNLVKLLPDGDPDVEEYKKLAKELSEMKKGNVFRLQVIDEMKQSAVKIEGKLAQWEKDGEFINSAGKKIKGLGSYSSAKRTASIVRQATNALIDGPKAFKLIEGASKALLGLNPLSIIATLAISWATETIAEKYRRKKAAMQCVLVMPLHYQGRQYTAGINGHKGMVVGDAPGRVDGFLSGAGLDGKDGEGGFTDFEWAIDTWNFLMDANDKDYSVSEEDLRSGNWKKE